MEILTRENLIDTLEYMIKVAKGSPKGSYFTVGDCSFSQIDKSFQDRAHKMGLDRALKQQKEAEKRLAKENNKKDNI
jgi:hypothetical protein